MPTSWYASGLTSGTPGGRFDNSIPEPMTAHFGISGVLRMTAGGIPGLRYDLDYTERLTPPDWNPVISGQAAVDGQVIFDHASDDASGFYRVRVFAP